MERKWGLVVTVCALAGLSGCGGSSGGSTAPTAVATPTPAPTPAPPVALLTGTFTLQNGFVGFFRTVTVPSTGLLEMTVDWTLASNDLDIALVRGACTVAMYEADTCDYVGFSVSETAKPEILRVNVTAGTYTPMVDSYGPGDESGAVQIVFTAGASVTAAAQDGTPRTRRSKKPARFIPLS